MVLDPMAGSGTVLRAAKDLRAGSRWRGDSRGLFADHHRQDGTSCIAMNCLDLNPDYLAIAAKRLAGITLPMAI